MPCRCDDYGEITSQKDKDRMDELYQHLCWACEKLEKLASELSRQGLPLDGTLSDCGAPPKLIKWWADHKEADKRRQRAESEARRRDAARKSGLKKLTAAEREALNIR